MNLFLQIRKSSKELCIPMKSLAPLLNSCGGCLRPCWEHQLIHLDSSWEKSPCGTNPSGKWMYSGHGSLSEGRIFHRPDGDDLSWAGTKYSCTWSSFEDKQENLPIKPYSSIISRTSCLERPFWMKSLKTWSTRAILRMPFSSSSRQHLENKGS